MTYNTYYISMIKLLCGNLCNRAITDSRYYEALPLSGVPSAWRGTNLEELLAIRFLVVALVQTLVALLSV